MSLVETTGCRIWIWFLISTKTRIETRLMFSIHFLTDYLISDFHQNKDWNKIRMELPGGKNSIWFLISTKTRIETKPTQVKSLFYNQFDFWFPPKQGLKLQKFLFVQKFHYTIWFLISTKTRIETDINSYFVAGKCFIWFLISTKTRIETQWIADYPSQQNEFDFWSPPKQGLKR